MKKQECSCEVKCKADITSASTSICYEITIITSSVEFWFVHFHIKFLFSCLICSPNVMKPYFLFLIRITFQFSTQKFAIIQRLTRTKGSLLGIIRINCMGNRWDNKFPNILWPEGLMTLMLEFWCPQNMSYMLCWEFYYLSNTRKLKNFLGTTKSIHLLRV